MSKDATLVCPNPKCHSDKLATREDLSGSAFGYASVDPTTGERTFTHEGWTEVWWDSSTTIGIECRACGWQNATGDWMSELILDPDSDAAQMELEGAEQE